MSARFLHSTLLTGLLMTTTAFSAPTPPVAATHDHAVIAPTGTRNDPYYWLRDDDRKNPDMLAYLKAENDYYQAMSKPYAGLREKLEKEIIGRIKQDDSTVPYKDKDFRYYTRYETGKEYPIYARTPVAGGAEQILIDGNKEARGKAYFQIGAMALSANQDVLAYLEDTSGRRQYTLRFRDLKTGKNLKESIKGLTPAVAWANDDKTIYYVENDPVTLLSTRIKKHVLGSDPKNDTLVYSESDKSFYMDVAKTGDDRFIMIHMESTVASEIRVLDADKPDSGMQLLAKRQRDVLYHADHIDGRWIIKTDWKAPNFRLMQVADKDIGDRARWQELLPYDDKVFIEDFALFKDYLAVEERSEGLLRIRVIPWAAPDKAFHIASDEPAYAESLDVNAEQDTEILRYSYTSLTTPASVYEVNMKTGERKLLKEQPVLGGFSRDNYATERVWAEAQDGTKIPVSLVYRKGFKRDGSAPLYQYAYGSYGFSSDPVFRASIVSLLDRGFVFAIAHIRGGQEMGRKWYDDGKLLNKKNTFSDFVAVTDYLVKEKYAAADKVFAMGGSAGGLLMGAVVNLAPEKYRGIVAHVPFVDVVTTMLDESIPLTTNEFDEWGNPKQKPYYDYMLSYSPYDNVAKKAYPAMLVTTGLHDSQVQYFEPAKWVAKLRVNKTDNHELLFKINMEAGHGGKSGRFARMKETADEYAFILHQLGMTQ